MSYLLRDVLESKKHPRPIASVPADELKEGERVFVRPLSLLAVNAMTAAKASGVDGPELAALLFRYCVCDEDGTPLFDDAADLSPQQLAGVNATPLTLVIRVVEASTAALDELKQNAKKASPATAG